MIDPTSFLIGEMYAALKDLVMACTRVERTDHIEVLVAVNYANKILAKAEGK